MQATSQIRRAGRLALVALTIAMGALSPQAPVVSVLAQSSANANVPCPDPGPLDYPIAAGWFYTQEARRCIIGVGPARRRGYTVVDDSQASFWTEFRRFGGVDVIGYPVTQRFNYDGDGFVYQAFERGVLQWHPETGRAEMANVFEMFTKQNLDPELEALGIPPPEKERLDLTFANDAERRMAWLSEPRFFARYLYDPIGPHSYAPERLGYAAFAIQEQAWPFFGLPQSLPKQPFMMAGKYPNQVSLDPLVHSFIAQRFQKGGMELFTQSVPNETFTPPGYTGNPTYLLDPTVVTGDGLAGCVALTAVGLLARTVGAGRIVPLPAIEPLPLFPGQPPFVDALIPPAALNQLMLQFQLSGSAFIAGERITIQLTDARASATGPVLPTVPPSYVEAANQDGSWDQVMTARIGTYQLVATGSSGKTSYIGIVDLTVPTTGNQSAVKLLEQSDRATTCRDVGLPIG